MRTRRQTLLAGSKVAVVAVITVLLFVLVINAMRNPVDAKMHSYSAEFTDASGLHKNGDVRLRGQRIGKVTSVDLQGGGPGKQPIARVQFTVDDQQTLTDTTTLAIKYQNLTGVRYIDVRPGTGGDGKRISHLPVSKTVPSFDITELFNGLQPVLTTMDSSEVNRFSENAIALLQGDGNGLGPMLESTQKLTTYAKDRAELLSTLTRNLARIADTMGGRSTQVMGFLQAVDLPMNNAMAVLDEFKVTASAGPALFEPVHRLLVALGINEEFDVDRFLKTTFKSAEEALKSFQLMPNALAGLRGSAEKSSFSTKCSHGKAQIPADVRVLMNGSEVILCKA